VNPKNIEKALRRWYYIRLIIRKILALKKRIMKRKINCTLEAWIEYSYAPIKGRPGFERGKKSFYDQQI